MEQGCGRAVGRAWGMEVQCCLTSPITLARWVPRASAPAHSAHRPLGAGQMSQAISVGQEL